ncbi:TetR/AcrR family transcriptional regulator [Clostridium senegalense]|uniref:TetR/AcrR family transcriptional regulator n=1 Tax=Clostridium senegalense TaxID=1465809 RepID=UPI001C11E479|nr:TetR/AcrR family transcriptional regulator [Clostridium senegalense]MBU5225844.1 TetR/AcrR family transcriptional regulator [Clostridium senegalense]
MPKIIKNLDEIIRKKTFRLFSEKGYDGVDIKLIAKECGMAVGTFYNYYSSKMELFMDILDKSWKETFKKIEESKMENLTDKERLEVQIEILYDDIENRKGLGFYIQQKYIFNSNKAKDMMNINDTIICNIKQIFEPLTKKACFNNIEDVNERLGYTLILQITKCLAMYPEKKCENLKFIKSLILSLVV